MQEAIGRQIGLVVGVEGFEQSARKQLLKLRYQRGYSVMTAAKSK